MSGQIGYFDCLLESVSVCGCVPDSNGIPEWELKPKQLPTMTRWKTMCVCVSVCLCVCVWQREREREREREKKREQKGGEEGKNKQKAD